MRFGLSELTANTICQPYQVRVPFSLIADEGEILKLRIIYLMQFHTPVFTTWSIVIARHFSPSESTAPISFTRERAIVFQGIFIFARVGLSPSGCCCLKEIFSMLNTAHCLFSLVLPGWGCHQAVAVV